MADLFDIVTARKLSGGGGGGGSSDFSTATMTVSNIEEKVLYAPIMDTAPISPPLDYIIAWGGAIPDGSYQVVLYKGNAIAQVPKGSVTLSGNIESLGNGMYLITGDCTITIS